MSRSSGHEHIDNSVAIYSKFLVHSIDVSEALGPKGILVHVGSYFIIVRRAVAVVTIVKWLRFSH